LCISPGSVTVNSTRLVPVPPEVVTEIGPEDAPTGTVAAIWDSEATVNEAGLPLKETAVATVKLVPVIVTRPPAGPLVGANAATTGGSPDETVKSVRVVNVPSSSVTEMVPVVAPAGTVALS
jgi:hypothetical protein